MCYCSPKCSRITLDRSRIRMRSQERKEQHIALPAGGSASIRRSVLQSHWRHNKKLSSFWRDDGSGIGLVMQMCGRPGFRGTLMTFSSTDYTEIQQRSRAIHQRGPGLTEGTVIEGARMHTSLRRAEQRSSGERSHGFFPWRKGPAPSSGSVLHLSLQQKRSVWNIL